MSEKPEWRRWPKVCKGRSGNANQRAYRWVQVWQVPTDVVTNFDAKGDPWVAWPDDRGYVVLGKYAYRGPVMSSIYPAATALARHVDGFVGLRWRCQVVKCEFVSEVLS